jgi:hypothetical protein
MRRLLTSVSLAVLGSLVGFPGAAVAQNSKVSVRLVDSLSTGSSQPRDTFSAALASPLIWHNHVVADRGAHVIGRVTQVVSSGWFKRPALITLSLGTAEGRSGSIPLQTGDLTIKADSHVQRNLLVIGGSSAAGAAIGGVAGGGKGAAIGAAAGAGAGTLGAYLTGKQEIVIPAETLLTFHISSVTISPQELAKLQSVASRNEPVYAPVEPYPVIVERRSHYHHHGDEDDDEEENEHEDHDCRCSPERIEVVFITNHRANVAVFWPHRVERVILMGDDLDDILEPLSERTHVSVEIIRPTIRIRRDDD